MKVNLSPEMKTLVNSLSAQARKEKLSYPFGRALYAVSRQVNGGLGGYSAFSYHRDEPFARLKPGFKKSDSTLMVIMRSAKPETAQRWLIHIMRGGSIRNLHTSHEAQKRRNAEQQRVYRLEAKERAKRDARRKAKLLVKLRYWLTKGTIVLLKPGEEVERYGRVRAVVLQDVQKKDDLVKVRLDKKFRAKKHDDGVRWRALTAVAEVKVDGEFKYIWL